VKSILRRLSILAVASAIWIASMQPGISVAQTSGVGWDGYTRLLWRASDQHAALWTLDSNLNFVSGIGYGPYFGWVPVALTTGNKNYSYVLWRTTTGNAAIWLLDPYLNYVTGLTTGDNPGWTPETLSTGTGYSNLRLTWRRYDAALTIMAFDQNLNYQGAAFYGPYFGYDAGPAPEALLRKTAAVRSRRLRMMPALAHTHADAVLRAARIMKQHVTTKAIPPLKKD